jgi:hypothetical protein
MVELRSAAARSSRILLALSRTANDLLCAERQFERTTPCPATPDAGACLTPTRTELQSERTTPCPATSDAGARLTPTRTEPQSERTTPCPARRLAGGAKQGVG